MHIYIYKKKYNWRNSNRVHDMVYSGASESNIKSANEGISSKTGKQRKEWGVEFENKQGLLLEN